MTDRRDVRPTWEYTKVTPTWKWDAMGADGWELVAVLPDAEGYFKRQTGWQVYKSKQVSLG